jgi:hypothetical protein
VGEGEEYNCLSDLRRMMVVTSGSSIDAFERERAGGRYEAASGKKCTRSQSGWEASLR